jgi:hypothetical protein
MLRPGGRRRRHRPSGLRRSLRWLPLAIAVAVLLGLLIGSLAEVGARSSGYLRTTDGNFAALAGGVVRSSNRTGAALAVLMNDVTTLSNGAVPFTARTQLQQGLDAAVTSSTADASRSATIAEPSPSGDVGEQFAAIMHQRATATAQVRSAIDRMLGMSPLPVAGSPTADQVKPPGPPLTTTAAATSLSAAGSSLQQADDAYRSLQSDIRGHRFPIRLPASVWVPAPVSLAPLGSVQLGATASALAASSLYVEFHHLVLSAVGFEPPAVPPSPGAPTAVPGVLGVSCGEAVSVGPGPAPTVIPPGGTVSVKTTVTNCGNVDEFGAEVTAALTIVDPPGTPPPPEGARGGSRTTTVTLRSGGSHALVFGPFGIAAGHLYLVTLTATTPGNEPAAPEGSTQQFVLQMTG